MARHRPGHSLASAAKLGSLLPNPIQQRNRVGSADSTDLYRVNLGDHSSFTVRINNRSPKTRIGLQIFSFKQARAAVLKAIGRSDFSSLKGKEIRRFLNPEATIGLKNRQQRSVNLFLNAGEYYVRVFHRQGNTSRYQLSLDAEPIIPTDSLPPIPVPQPIPAPIPAPILTPIPAPVPAPTPIPPFSPSPNPIPSPIPSPILSPLPSPNPVPSPLPSPLPSPIPSPLPSPDPSPFPDPSPSPNPSPTPVPLPSLTQSWLQQFGTEGNDYTYGTTTDSAGNVYLSGVRGTIGSTVGNAFVAKYTSTGTLEWSRDLPNGNASIAFDIAVSEDGSYYIAGATNVNYTTAPTSDGFVAKYSSDGSQLWRETIATTVSLPFFGNRAALDAASGIAIDPGGNVVVSGFIKVFPGFATTQGNGFIAKYEGSTGAAITEFGTAGRVEFGETNADAASKVAVDLAGNIYITGIADATLTTNPANPYSGGDAFIAAYNPLGGLLWSDRLGESGTVQEYGRAIAVSGDRVYITGQTASSLPDNTLAGSTDGFLASYDRISGDRQWVRQFGTSGLEESQGIAVDANDRIYLAGETTGSLFGNVIGGSDAWIAVYDESGSLLTSKQFGTAQDDEAYGITVDSQGNVYGVGQTFGAFPENTSQGEYDGWVAQYGNG